ncbi:MAG: hypothetical protein RLZZ502_43 [Pseudomonadota bacterium]
MVFIDFFYHLKSRGLPVSTREYLTLLEAVKAGVIGSSVDEFYSLSKTALVKDETRFDRFDQAFSEYFSGVAAVPIELLSSLPEEWLRRVLEKNLSPEELKKLEALDWQTLMDTLKQRLEEQKERHQGGNKWIGTGGTSPFGAYGVNPAGVRIGQAASRNRSAVKVWDQRAFRDYDSEQMINARTIKIALRRLRRFARTGALDELDMDGTLRDTARDAGLLNIVMRPERRNAVKVLLLLDVGGSMDDHIREVEEMFSAVKSEFKHLVHFYFHNCVYDHVWKENFRRQASRMNTMDLLNKYGSDYRLILVGDAAMSPYEITQIGGSVEYMNPEAGYTWLTRLNKHFKRIAWINPEPKETWEYRQSNELIRQAFENRMYPMSLDGLTEAMKGLSK